MSLGTVLRRLLADVLLLQRRYADRFELSGTETVTAMRTLRWSGDELRGDWLPSCSATD